MATTSVMEEPFVSTRSWKTDEESESDAALATTCLSDRNQPQRGGCPSLKYRSRGFIGKGALLVMASSFALHTAMPYNMSAILLQRILNSQASSQGRLSRNVFISMYKLLCIVFPLSGLIADSIYGRYKVILYSIGILVISSVLMLIAFPLSVFTGNSNAGMTIAASVIAGFAAILNFIGYAGHDANVIQFLTDQKLGASGEELSGVINLYFCVESFSKLSNILLSRYALSSDVGITELLIVHFIMSAITLYCYIALKKYLDTTPRILNPIKLLFCVLKYAKQNRYPKNRSALTLWEDTKLTRVDMAKSKYGGPFTEEQVEDVKTGLRLLPIIIVTAGVGIFNFSRPCTSILNAETEKIPREVQGVLLNEGVENALMTLLFIPIYHYLIYPFLYKRVPSLLKRIGFGVLLISISFAYLTFLDPVRNHVDDKNICIFSNITITSELNGMWCLPYTTLAAFSQMLIVVFGFEFIVAQSPQSMKGLAIGIWFACYGIFEIVSYNMDKPFSLISTSTEFSCGFYYFLTKTLVSMVALALYILLAKRYTMRVRDTPINIHIIAEDHFIKYIDLPSSSESSSYGNRRYSYDSDSSSCSSCTSE